MEPDSEPKRVIIGDGDARHDYLYRVAEDRLLLSFRQDGGPPPADFDSGTILTLRRLISGEQLAAVRKGLAFLSQAQQPDGSFHSAPFDRLGVTALCTLALVYGESMAPDDYHERIDQALDHILSRQITRRDNRGYFDGGRVGFYDLGYAIWLLSRLHDSVRYRDRVHEPLQRAVEFSVNAQQENGGWGYGPRDTSWTDLSNTIVQLRALAEAHRQGFAVPEECFASAVEWLGAHQDDSGAFRYVEGGAGSFSCTAQALSALKHLGIDEGPVPERGWEAFARYAGRPRTNIDRPRTREEQWFLYGSMFALDALGPDLDRPTFRWYRQICDTLVDEQRADGSWRMEPESGGPELATALVCLILLPQFVLD